MSRSEIRGHVESLFDAYLAGDLDTLRQGRSTDWKGFQIRSTHLVKGVDEYMVELGQVVGELKVARYEFLDFDIDVYGDIALVFYIARDHLTRESGADGPDTILVRSLDVYRRSDSGWTQIASNICTVPDSRAAVE